MIHELKTLPQYFKAVKEGTKTFEIRKNDRGFKTGDSLILKEYLQEISNANRITIHAQYTGQEIVKEISYVLEGGQYGLEEGYCILGLKDIEPQKVYVEVVNRDGLFFPCVFSNYQNLIKYEESIEKDESIKVVCISHCKMDERTRMI